MMKKLTKSEIDAVKNLAEDKFKNLRKGQAFFVALVNLHSEIANTVWDTEYDCFYHSDRIKKLIKHISITDEELYVESILGIR